MAVELRDSGMERSFSAADPRALWEAAGTSMQSRRAYRLAKSVTDRVLALVLIVLFSPVFLLAAIAIKLTSPGPVFFNQSRLGQEMRTFRVIKFRSMVANADEKVHQQVFAQYAQGIAAETRDGKERFKPENDPRITKVGKLLRKSHLDELPQLFNVLMGQMSLVGPRPAIPYELAHYQPSYYQRFAVPAGITGYWQVHGGSRVSFETMIEMDLEYVGKASYWQDLKLMLLTVPVMLFRSGE